MMGYRVPDRQIPQWVDHYDPDEHKIGACAGCGGDIYDDESYYDIDGELVHEDCIDRWAEQYRVRRA